MAKRNAKTLENLTETSTNVVDMPTPKKSRRSTATAKAIAAVTETSTETSTEPENTETPEEKAAREAAEAEAKAKAEAEEIERLASETEDAIHAMEEAEAATAGTLVPAYLNLGKRLIELQGRFKSLKLFGQFLKDQHPAIADVPSDLRSNCKWLAENEEAILNAFGLNEIGQIAWANPATIKRKFIAWEEAQNPAEVIAEGVDGETEDDEAESQPEERDTKAEAVADFIYRFSKMSKADMIETMTDIVKIGLDRKLKVGDLAD